MGRGKLALELITMERSRRTTYEKRKKGLVKKAEEFSILCGVDTCVIIYGPDGSNSSVEPTIWPTDHEEVKRIIERYQREGMECRAKRTAGLAEFFMTQKRKVENELVKARLACWNAKYPVTDELISNFNDEGELRKLLGVLAARLEIAKKMHSMMKENMVINPGVTVEDLCFSSHAHYMQVQGMFQEQQTPMSVKPLDVKAPMLEYDISPYLPSSNNDHSSSMNNTLGTMMLKDNNWPHVSSSIHSSLGLTIPGTLRQHDSYLTQLLALDETRVPSANMNCHPFTSFVNMSMQANNLHHHHLGSPSSINNSNQELLASQCQLVNNHSVHIDHQNVRALNNMIMFDYSNSSMCYNFKPPPLLPSLLQYPVMQASASATNASQGNQHSDLSGAILKKIEREN